MEVRTIRIYGDPVLRKKVGPVKEVTESHRRLGEDMIDTMVKADGVGIAAPQVGESIRMYALNLTAITPDLYIECRGRALEGKTKPDYLVLVNPKIVKQEGEQTGDEGWLSLPEMFDRVTRPNLVRVEATDLDGDPLEIEGTGLLARVLIHEYDHLEGILFIDYLNKFRLQFHRKKLKKFKESIQVD